MHRPLFKELKERYPGSPIVFAIPKKYIPLVNDHPYIDKVIAIEDLNGFNFTRTFSTLGRSAVYEATNVPFVDKHRTELWAEYMKVPSFEYDAYFRFSKSENEFADKFLAPHEGLKIGFAPVSAHPSKDIEREKIQEVINRLSADGHSCFVFHTKPLGYENSTEVNIELREWMVLTSRMDVIITVATSTFHLANFFHIPTVAIFGCENLDTYGKFFPEMVPLQRTREMLGWSTCPCWNGNSRLPYCYS